MLNRNINRRNFIKSFLMTSGAIALSSRIGIRSAQALENVTVLVVGAGIAGLGAGQHGGANTGPT